VVSSDYTQTLGLRQESPIAMDSGRSHRQAIVCGLDYLAVDLLPLRRVAEAGVEEGDASSRSARGLHILPNPGSTYIPKREVLV
jgi:hypothetical protein